MKTSIYKLFKVALEKYLFNQGDFCLEAELDSLTAKMLDTCTIAALPDNHFKLVTNNTLITPDFEGLDEELTLPDLVVFREVDKFKTAGSELISQRNFIMHSIEELDDAENIILGFGAGDEDIIVLYQGEVLDYKIYNNTEEPEELIFPIDEDEVEDEDEDKRWIWWNKAVIRLELEGIDSNAEEYHSQRLLVSGVKDAYNSGYSKFRAFSLITNKQLHFKLFEELIDTSHIRGTECLKIVFLDDNGDRVYSKHDDGDETLPF